MDCIECGQQLSSDREILGYVTCEPCAKYLHDENISELCDAIQEQVSKGLSVGEAASEVQMARKCTDGEIDQAMWLVNNEIWETVR